MNPEDVESVFFKTLVSTNRNSTVSQPRRPYPEHFKKMGVAGKKYTKLKAS
jgi:hypothetical protein